MKDYTLVVPLASGGVMTGEILSKKYPLNVLLERVAKRHGEQVKKRSVMLRKDQLPSGKWRPAWEFDPTIKHPTLRVNLAKAKIHAHDRRRKIREFEMKPYDDIVAKQIPGTEGQAAEAERAKLRKKYDDAQTAIDNATTLEELETAITAFPWSRPSPSTLRRQNR